jgi:hypothetical protein
MDFDDSVISTDNTTERVVKLAGVRRSIANFVRILTNDDTIKVVFSSNADYSYTDGRVVVISADSDSKKFDSMVGLALHEGAHCLLSDFNFLRAVIARENWRSCYLALSKELRNTIPNMSTAERDVGVVYRYQEILGTLMNIIEDRRIDSYIYQTASGYRPYYNALYSRYFFNAEVDKNLRHNPEWRIPSIDNYTNWLVNIFNPAFDGTALPGLQAMSDLIDIKNIRRFDTSDRMSSNVIDWEHTEELSPWSSGYSNTRRWEHSHMFNYESLPMLWRTANDLLLMMIQYVSAAEMEKTPDESDEPVTISLGNDKYNGDVSISAMAYEESSDGDSSAENKTPPSPATAGKFNDIINVTNGQLRRKKVRGRELEEINQLESADAKVTEAGDKIIGDFPCLVTRKLNKSIMLSAWFPFSRKHYYNNNELYLDEASQNAVNAGIRMGQILAHRLQVRNDPMVTTFTRQPHGKVDRRILAQLGMDIEQVFKRTTVDSFKPVMLHLSLDASGSMHSTKWHQTMTVATALAYVASKIRNIETVITLRGDSNIPIVSVVYDSRTDNIQKVRTLFPYLQPNGSTPEGLCYKATLGLITECADTHDVYFINFSDGEPGTSVMRRGQYNSYSGDEARNHTRRQVQMMREAGVKVLSYFISEGKHAAEYSKQSFIKMYGEDAVFVNVSNVTEVLRTLNKLLLKRA